MYNVYVINFFQDRTLFYTLEMLAISIILIW